MNKSFKLWEMEFSSNNVFELDDPESYNCRIWCYSKGHSVLVIHLQRKESHDYEPLFLVFDAVQYFEGVFGWTGADFQTASREEYANLLIKLQPELAPSKEVMLSPEKLPHLAGHVFVIHTSSIDIKFWAHHATLTDDISGWSLLS